MEIFCHIHYTKFEWFAWTGWDVKTFDQVLIPGFTSMYEAIPYELTIDWKTFVNLLVRLYVGGVSEVSRRFKMAADRPHPLFSFGIDGSRKRERTWHAIDIIIVIIVISSSTSPPSSSPPSSSSPWLYICYFSGAFELLTDPLWRAIITLSWWVSGTQHSPIRYLSVTSMLSMFSVWYTAFSFLTFIIHGRILSAALVKLSLLWSSVWCKT